MPTIPLDIESDRVVLPPPSFAPGASLEEALKKRRSARSFRDDALPLQTVATLLWAGCGMNRPAQGHRTSPSAHNWQEVSILAVVAEGAYRYDPAGHRLLLVDTQDLRGVTGLQDFVAAAPLNLVYVADFTRMQDCPVAQRNFFTGADAAFVAQNVSLCCAVMGLATVVRALIDRQALAAALKLSPTQRIALAQTVGLPGAQP
jgi:nitroreductase